MTDDVSRTAWTEPGVEQVAPGVHRIPLPLPHDGLRAVNVYAIEAPDGLVLVDGGWALEESRRTLADGLARLDRSLGDITRFLVTHVHRDHYTQAVAIRREFGSRVALGAGERPGLLAVQQPGWRALTAQVELLRRCGADPVVAELLAATEGQSVDRTDWELPDEWLEGSPRLAVGDRELLAVPTPGHTQGHLVFADLAGGLLFAGDHVLPQITPSIGFEAKPGDLPLGDYLRSLAVVRQLPDLLLLPAHGPVAPSVHARVDALVDHHDARLDATLRAVDGGAATAYEVARVLLWTRRERRFDDMTWFDRMLATTETAAHLDVLAARGTLAPTHQDGVRHYLAS